MAAKTRAALNAQAAADLADNVAGDISAEDVRGMCEDLADSMGIWVSVPAAYDSAGEAGQISGDGEYFYYHNGTRWFRRSIDAETF